MMGCSFCIVTFGDDLFTRTLPKNMKEANMKLAPHFYQYFDIFTEFKKYIPGTNNLRTLTELMAFTNLKEKEGTLDSVSLSDCKAIVRLVNMLNRAGYIFNTPVKSYFKFYSYHSKQKKNHKNHFFTWMRFILTK